MSKRFLFLFFLTYGSVVIASTYYVAPNGADSSKGTKEKPWASWKMAFQVAQAGDTVYFRGGKYSIDNQFDRPAVTNSGTAENPICFFAYPPDVALGNYPELDYITYTTPPNYFYGVLINGKSYIHIKDLRVTGIESPVGYLLHGFAALLCTNIIIENCVAHHIEGTGFGIYGCDEAYIKNCDAYNCCDSIDGAGYPGNDGNGFEFNFAILEDPYSARICFQGCRAWNCGDNGFSGSGLGHVEFDNCWSFSNGMLRGGSGCGFKLGWGSGNQDTINPSMRYVHNCIAVNNGAYGLSPNNGSGEVFNMQVYNNFFYHNGYRRNSFLYAPSSWGTGITIYDYADPFVAPREMYANNLAYANELAPVYEGDVYTHENNSWDQPDLTISDDDFMSLDTLELFYPRQLNGSLPDITFGKLAPESGLIDRGTTKTGLPYNGSAPDLGWFESYLVSSLPDVPALISSIIHDATPSSLDMTYNSTLANILPAASAFTVKVNAVTRTVNSVAISGTKVILTLASPVVYGDVVTVAYTKPSYNPLQSASGGQASSIATQDVTNNCTLLENQPPVIDIASPTKSTSFISPATITINAVASDPDGSIAKVEFFNGTSKIGERTSEPYSYTWKEIPEGTYTITAAATDNQNLRTVSSEVSVVVEKSATIINQVPIVSISSPEQGKKYKKNDRIVIEAAASDPDGFISKVEFKSGNITLIEMTTAPYFYIWEATDTGRYVVTVIATDNLGAISNISSLELIVDALPAVNSDIINLYPNPTYGHFTINLFSDLEGRNNRITILNLSGETVYNDLLAEQESFKEFDLSDVIAGTYVLILSKDNLILSTKKFIKN